MDRSVVTACEEINVFFLDGNGVLGGSKTFLLGELSVVVGVDVAEVWDLPGPLIFVLFIINSCPLEWAEHVVRNGCSNGSVLVRGGVLTFELLGTLVPGLVSRDFLIAFRGVEVAGKKCSPSRWGGDTIHTWMGLRYAIDSLADGGLIILRTWLKGQEGRSSGEGRELLRGALRAK